MQQRVLIRWFVLSLCTVLPSSVHAQDAIRDLVVKIHAIHHSPDLLRPWTKSAPRQVNGSGVVINGKRILTNAHVVKYASQIYVQPRHQNFCTSRTRRLFLSGDWRRRSNPQVAV